MTKHLARLMLCAALSAFGATVLADSPVPIKHFFTRNVYSQPRLSPSGRYLSIVSPDPDYPERNLLAIVDLKGMKIFRTFRVATGDEEMFGRIEWVNDHRLVFTTAFRLGGFDQPFPTGRIYAINVDGNNVRLLQRNKSWRDWVGYSLLHVLREDPYHIITGSYSRWNPPQAFLVDVRGNNGTLAASWGKDKNPNVHRIATSPLQNGWLRTDHAGHVRLALGYGAVSGGSRWAYRDTGAMDWKQLPEKLFDPVENVGPVGFTADDKQITLLAYAPSGTLGLYNYDPDTKKKTLVYDDPANDIDATSFYDGLMYGPRRNVVAVITMPGRPKLTLIGGDGPAAKMLKAFSTSFPNEFPRVVSWTRDGSKAVVEVSSGRDPGLYYLVDTRTLHAAPLFKHRPDIDPADMASVKPFSFKARDALVVHGYITSPKQDKSPPPMIVYVHGGPHGIRDQWRFDPMAQLLASRGYAVLQVNYRGSAGYGRTYMRAGYRHWGTTMQYDVIDATRWAIKQGYADPKRICILGGSYGGFAALRSSELAPDLYKCTVGYDGVYDLPMMFKKGDITWSSFGPHYLHYVLGDDMADLKDQSPVSHVDKLKSAIYLIQGGSDRRAPPAQVDELKAALDSAGKHYEYLYKENEGHGFYKVSDQRELAKKLLDFFDKSIGG